MIAVAKVITAAYLRARCLMTVGEVWIVTGASRGIGTEFVKQVIMSAHKGVQWITPCYCNCRHNIGHTSGDVL